MSDDAPNENLPELENVSKPRRGRRSNAEIAAEVEALKAAQQPKPAPEPFGGKGDHDGDGKVGGAAPAIQTEEEKPEGFDLYAGVPIPKLVAMELKRHYRPAGYFEIVGYNQPEISRKGVTGALVVVQVAAFVTEVDPETGNMKQSPPPLPGISFKDKIWAGTVIKVTPEEAKRMRLNGIAERTVDD